MYKAYILSRQNGVVQIGNTVYQPSTGAIFRAGRVKRKEVINTVEVSEKSMAGAIQALAIDARQD